MIPRMRAIEYNMLMSLCKYISIQAPIVSSDYNMSGTPINIHSSYPKDLTKFKKPSIIVQKVHTGQSSIGFGNVLGSYYDIDDNRSYDVSGRVHEMVAQFNIIASTETHCMLLTSLVSEGILNKLDDRESGNILELRDFVGDMDGTLVVGRVDVSDELDIMYMQSNDNKDYTGIIRTEFRTVQSILCTGDFVDLSKGIKYTQTIML